MAQLNASVARYQAHLDAKGRRRAPGWSTTSEEPQRPHWWRLNRLRRHQPVRPDQLAEVWDAWLAAHGDDMAAALGALVAHHVDQGGTTT